MVVFSGWIRCGGPGPSPGFPVSAVLTRAQVERFPGSRFRYHVPISGPRWPSKASWRLVRPRVRGRVPEDLIDPVSKILGALRPSAHVCGKGAFGPYAVRGRARKVDRERCGRVGSAPGVVCGIVECATAGILAYSDGIFAGWASWGCAGVRSRVRGGGGAKRVWAVGPEGASPKNCAKKIELCS